MFKILAIAINCGENTCASEPGKFCEFLGAKNFGMIPVCMLFQENLDTSNSVTSEHEMGWVLRCNKCKSFTQKS